MEVLTIALLILSSIFLLRWIESADDRRERFLMPPQSRLYEGMRKITTVNFVIRMWIQIADPKNQPFERSSKSLDEIKRDTQRLVLSLPDVPGQEMEVVQALAGKIPGLNALEVLNHTGEGGLVYMDWP